MIPGAAGGNCPLKQEIHVLGESVQLGMEGEKDLLTGEGFALVVTLRKGNPGGTRVCMEIPRQRNFSRLVCTCPSPCLTYPHPHLHDTIQGASGMDISGMSGGILSSGGRAGPAASPHSCHSRSQAQAPAGEQLSLFTRVWFPVWSWRTPF